MGGVDLFDSQISLYRIQIRSKEWYLCIMFQLFNLICVEAWLLYRRDCVKSGVTNEMPLLECKSELAQCLPVAPIKRKVGRHPSSDVEMQLEAKQTEVQLLQYHQSTTRYLLRSDWSDDIGPHMPNVQCANYKDALDLPKSRAISE